MNDDIHVWQVDLARSPADPQAIERTLSVEEHHRAGRFHFSRDRDAYIRCRFALRQILGRALNLDAAALEITTGTHGKPQLNGGSLRFNVSHSGDRALIAVARGREIGVDVEKLRMIDDALAIARSFFSQQEVERLALLADPLQIARAFFECWTRKEAYIKAVGKGLSHPLDSFSVSFFPDPSANLGSPLDQRWSLINIDALPEYCAALVFERLTDAPDPRMVQSVWDDEMHLPSGSEPPIRT